MGSRFMTDAEARYLMHAVGGDPLIATYLDNQANAGYDVRQTMANMPACPKCEKIAFHHEQGIVCPSCGYRGAKSHKVSDHIYGRLYR